MKYELNIQKDIKEVFVKIIANSITDEIERLIKILEEPDAMSEIFIGICEDYKVAVNKKDIIRFYAEDKKVYFQTEKDKYITKFKLYELEEKLDKKEFIRISNSEIVALKEIERLDSFFKGTIKLTTKSGIICYVSRSYLKNFKKVLNI